MRIVKIFDRDSKLLIKDYTTVLEGEAFDKELTDQKLSILKESGIPFKWQEVKTQVV